MKLNQFLKSQFGYDDFRPGQREIIESALNLQNVLGVLATGSGKSLCYQFVSYWLDGLTIVVTPLISLMEDQVTRFKQKGFKKVGLLHSGLEKERYRYELDQLRKNNRKILYISPERLCNAKFLMELSTYTVSLLVIDEAHCVSQWGYDFRPDYLFIHTAYAAIGNPPVMALTGTASPKVQNDILEKLCIMDAKKVVLSMNRPNIAFYLHKAYSENDKQQFLRENVLRLQGPGIIYASTRKQTDDLAKWLSSELNIEVLSYHAGLSDEDRNTIQAQFISGQASLMVATNAFGMGIDKENIRFVIHYQMPTSIENYLQEIGRIGRDGKEGIAILLYHEEDPLITKSIIDSALPDRKTIQETIQILEQQTGFLPSEEELYEHMPVKSIFYRMLQKGWVEGEYRLGEFKWRKKVNENDIDLLVSEWEQLRYEKLKNIEHFWKFIHSEKCFRKNLLNYISESDNLYNVYCCSKCTIDLSHYFKNEADERAMKSSNFQWQDELERLLPVHKFGISDL